MHLFYHSFNVVPLWRLAVTEYSSASITFAVRDYKQILLPNVRCPQISLFVITTDGEVIEKPEERFAVSIPMDEILPL